MNSRLLIPAVVVACAVMGIGTIIYNFASSSIGDVSSTLDDSSYSDSEIVDANDTMSSQEIDAFNNQYLSYEGYQTGSNVKALMARLISNLHTYREEPTKVPQVYIDKLSELNSYSAEVIFHEDNEFQDYVDNLNRIRNTIETKHEYYIEMTYQENGLIDYIQISYDASNPITDFMHRD